MANIAQNPGRRIGIIAGAGTLPFAVASAIRARGEVPVLFALRAYCDAAALIGWPHHWVALGQFGRLFALLRAVLLLPAGLVSDSKVAMGLLIAACVALGLFTSNVWAITQTLAGTEAAGKWTGIQNFIGNLGGVVAPIVTGMIVQRTGEFFLAFVTAAGVLVLGAGVYLGLVGRVEPVTWTEIQNKTDKVGDKVNDEV